MQCEHADRLAHMHARAKPALAWTGFHRPVEQEEPLAPVAAAWGPNSGVALRDS